LNWLRPVLKARKIKYEQIVGHESSADERIVYKTRIIDNIQDVYFEEVKDSNSNIVHKCEEKLSGHKGHGSARKKGR